MGFYSCNAERNKRKIKCINIKGLLNRVGLHAIQSSIDNLGFRLRFQYSCTFFISTGSPLYCDAYLHRLQHKLRRSVQDALSCHLLSSCSLATLYIQPSCLIY